MSEQLPLFAEPKPGPNRHRLLLALFPDAAAVDSIYRRQAELREEFGLTGKPRPREILHVTLHKIGDYPEIPETVVNAAREASAIALADRQSFEVIFDQVISFAGRPGNHPLVLRNLVDNQSLIALHRSLITELAKRRLAGPQDFHLTPHVTMLYDKHFVLPQPIHPVGWKVKEVVLILSHLGATKYERLGCWSLSDPM